MPSIDWTLQVAFAPAPLPVVQVVQEIVVDATSTDEPLWVLSAVADK